MRRLYDKACQALKARETWEERQRVWYKMRHDGLPRRHKPWPGAADMHYPLIDEQINKLTPFYFNQVFQTERLAEFVALKEQLNDLTRSAEEFFNYQLKQRSNWEEALLPIIDTMCLTGIAIGKHWFDPAARKLCTEAIHPLYLIVPPGARRLDDADWFVHVQQFSEPAFQRDWRFRELQAKRDWPDTLTRIRGGADSGAASDHEYQDEKVIREGLTTCSNKEQILVWEHYEKTEGGWTVRTFSPQAPEIELRRPFGLPKIWQGKPLLPFVLYRMEAKDEGWYSPRGVAEKLAPFEATMCRMWNEKHDYMAFTNKPLFEDEFGALQNKSNFRFEPGAILPRGVRKAQMGEPPFAFDQEMVTARMTAEQYMMMPDFGVGDKQGKSQNKTATEVEAITALMSQGVNLRGRIFRRSISDSYRLCWALIVHHLGEEMLEYFAGEERKQLSREALHDLYEIHPDGSPDQWHRQLRHQRAVQRYQMFNQHPNVIQEELVKSVIEEDDPRLVDRLYMPSQQKAASEIEDEAGEILLMKEGFPAQALANEDHAIRIQTICDKVLADTQNGVDISPIGMQRMQAHMQQHLEFLQQQNPQQAKQVQQMIAQMLQQLQAVAAQEQQMAAMGAGALGQGQEMAAAQMGGAL